jgi:Putative Flp pilus-assembly TadE/G-like
MDRADPTTKTRKPRSRGQIAVVFAAAMIVVVGLCAIVVDVSWFWANSLRMQRAADAAALAGVVMLPGDEASAIVRAEAEAAKNGYTDGVGGVVVTAWQDTTNPRRLRVNLTANVGTFFARVLGINSFPAGVQAKADYTLPVPMGSPENYYGVFGLVRHPGGGVTNFTDFTNVTTSAINPSSAMASPNNQWATNTNVYSSNNAYSTETAANEVQGWRGFTIALNSSVQNIDGVTIQAEMSRSGSGNQTNCQVAFDLSWNGGTTWTTGSGTGVKTSTALPTVDAYQTFGSSTDKWGRSSWSASDFTTANNFAVRARAIKPSTAVCANAINLRIDHIRVLVTYDYQTSVFVADSNLTSPTGGALNPRGFWGTMLTQGAESINGDAYSPFYDTRTGTNNPNYSATEYYQYAVEMPAGATGGQVWVYDPAFCAVASDMGTGDRYFGNTNTNGSNEISAYYNLYNTQNTLYDATDDGSAVASSGTFFANQGATDEDMNGPNLSGGNLTDCSATTVGGDTTNPQYYHNRWYQLTSTLTGSGTGGTIYRLHVSSTDPSNANAQKNMNGQNSFALYATATGGTPRIYGLGAMEAYSPLPASATSTFYLAQIGAEHAGKTVAIELWDPGDTNGLTANLAIRIPGTSGYSSATLNWTSAEGTTNTNASNCNSSSGTGVTTITAANGSTSNFNGCWVTILVQIPTTYTAPTPPGETQPGWWKIQYTMGSGSSTAFDLTTWQVEIRGNPVHLVLP